MEHKYKILFQSKNIDYVEVNPNLINDYLIMVNDIEIQRRISSKSRIFTYEEEENWINNKLENKDIIFSMIERNTNEFIGNIELMHVTEKDAELGICITSKKQGKHYGLEAIKKLIEYSFDVLGLEEINLVVFSTNQRAIKCYKKLGFKEYKIEKNVENIDNIPTNDIYMKLHK